MARFSCKVWPFYKVIDKDRVLNFENGVLETDDRGAGVIRALPEFGRLIVEGDWPKEPTRRRIDATENGWGLQRPDKRHVLYDPEDVSDLLQLVFPRSKPVPETPSPSASKNLPGIAGAFYRQSRVSNPGDPPGPFVARAMQFVREAFEENPNPPSKETTLRAKERGIFRYSLTLAKDRLGVRSVESGRRGQWVWARTRAF